MQRGELGGRNLNMVLQEALNPTGPAIQRYGWTFRVGDKVMQTVNDYDKDVFNGDIGRIAKIDEVEQEVTVRFDGPARGLRLQRAGRAAACPTPPRSTRARAVEYPVVVMPDPHPALHDAPAEPALHGDHAEAGSWWCWWARRRRWPSR